MRTGLKQAVRTVTAPKKTLRTLEMALETNITDGVFAINKPTGISSAQVIRDVQSSFSPSTYFSRYMAEHRKSASKKQRRMGLADRVKMGHGGTLDPLATGVLILGVGSGTKELNDFLNCTKSYEAVVLFGAATDTYDRLGKVIGRKPHAYITKTMVEDALSTFRGKIMQQPPIFSALRMDGKRLYEYAREGKELPREIEKRPVEVLDVQLTEWMEGGTHKFVFPEEEAEEDAKAFAADVLKFRRTPDAEQDQMVVGTGQNPSTGKRKHELVEEQQSEANKIQEKKPKTQEHSNAEDDVARAESQHLQANVDNSGSHSSSADRNPSNSPPAARIRMTVTSGFYVRSLCHDLGAAVGSLAIMSELVRTRQGDFELGQNVMEFDLLSKGEEVWAPELQPLLESWKNLKQD